MWLYEIFLSVTGNDWSFNSIILKSSLTIGKNVDFFYGELGGSALKHTHLLQDQSFASFHSSLLS